MEPKIVMKEALKIIGMRVKTTQKNNLIPRLWEQFNPRVGEIKFRDTREGALGICEYEEVDNFNDNTEFSYIACVVVSNIDSVPPGMVSKTLLVRKYTVFTHRGPVMKIGETFHYIFGTWLPKSGYKMEKADNFEYYDQRFTGVNRTDSEVDIYIPIK